MMILDSGLLFWPPCRPLLQVLYQVTVSSLFTGVNATVLEVYCMSLNCICLQTAMFELHVNGLRISLKKASHRSPQFNLFFVPICSFLDLYLQHSAMVRKWS